MVEQEVKEQESARLTSVLRELNIASRSPPKIGSVPARSRGRFPTRSCTPW